MKQQAQAGFSLLELMVVVAVLAVVASIAVPSMQDAAATLQVRQAAGCLSNSLSNVRSLAMSSTQSAYLRPVSNGTAYNVWNSVANDKATVTFANTSSNLSGADKTKLAQNGASWYVATGTDTAETLRESCVLNDNVRVFAMKVPNAGSAVSSVAPTLISYDFSGRRTDTSEEMLFAVCRPGSAKVFRLTTSAVIGLNTTSMLALQQVKDSAVTSELAPLKTLIGTSCDA